MLRVVFDALCQEFPETLLIETMLPVDIVKMYKQFVIHQDDRAFQCILW